MAYAPGTRVVRHSSALGEWESVVRPPAPRLREHIRHYMGYVLRYASFQRGLEVPTIDVVLIVNLGAALRIVDPRDPVGSAVDCNAVVGGLSDSYIFTESNGSMDGLQINFTPLGAYRFLGLPMSEVTNRVVELEDLFGAWGRRLRFELQEAPGWEARFAILDAVFTTRISAARGPAPGIVWAWGRLSAADGRIDIGSLATELGWSRKHLISQFKEQIGLAPKTVARVLRFRRAIRLLEGQESVRWAEIAYDCGYYDQAHFNRDFREFTGLTPGEYLGRILPDGGGLAGDAPAAR
jgi:AraC-like DNA-binding protein